MLIEKLAREKSEETPSFSKKKKFTQKKRGFNKLVQNYIIEKVTLHSLHVAIVFTPSASKINNFQFSPRFKRAFKFTYMPHRSFRICLVSRFSQRKRYRRTADEAVLFQVWPKVKPVLSRIPPCKHSTHTSPSSAMRSKKNPWAS